MKHLLALTLALLASGVQARNNLVHSVDFVGVPDGTTCNAEAPWDHEVEIQKTSRKIRVSITGDARGACFFCDLPDGRRVEAAVPSRIPDDAHDARLQVNPDGRGVIVFTQDGEVKLIQLRRAVKDAD